MNDYKVNISYSEFGDINDILIKILTKEIRDYLKTLNRVDNHETKL